MSKWYVETRFNDNGGGLVQLISPEEADEDFDITPFSSFEGYDRYVDGFDTEEAAREFYEECLEECEAV